MMAERVGKHVALAPRPTEREWALSQPAEWQYACLAFAIASNTRGGVVGKPERLIVSEANAAGIEISLRTFKRRVAVLQARGIIFKDEPRPDHLANGMFSQRASTWLLHLDRIMPPGVPVTSPERWHTMTPGEWMDGEMPARNPWRDDPMEAIPF